MSTNNPYRKRSRWLELQELLSRSATSLRTCRWSTILSCILMAAIAGVCPSLPAQDPVKAKDELSLPEILKSEASGYRIELLDEGKSTLTMHPDSVLSWVNPVRFQQQGFVYVWTHEGRARAIGGVFSNQFSEDRMFTSHEFHSLAPVGLRATLAGKDVWHPDEPGIEFVELKEAPVPAEKKTGRLAQMRRLAQQFSAYSITQEESRYELRLLTAPLFRYQTDESDIHDGAIFSMVTSAGTDPEILLVFEVRDTANGPKWHYAPARFSDSKLYLLHHEKPVWEFTYPKGTAGYQHRVSAADRYRLWDNREFTPNEMRRLLKNAKTQSVEPAKR